MKRTYARLFLQDKSLSIAAVDSQHLPIYIASIASMKDSHLNKISQ